MRKQQSQSISEALTRTSAFGLHIAVFLLLWPILTGLPDADDAGLGKVINVHLFDLLGGAGLALGVLVVRALLKSTKTARLRQWQTLALMAMIAASAWCFQIGIASLFGRLPDVYLTSFGIGFLSSFGLLVLGHLLSTGFVSLALAARALAVQQVALNRVRRDLEASLAEQRQAVSERVLQVVLPLLDDISSQLRGQSNQSALSGQILQLVNTKIRPLSHELVDQNTQAIAVVEQKRPSRWRSAYAAFTRNVSLPSAISASMTGLLALIFVLPSHVFYEGVALALVGCLPAIGLQLGIGLFLRRRLNRIRLPLPLGFVATAAYAFLGSGLLALNWALAPKGMDAPTAAYLQLELFLVALAAGLHSLILASRWSAFADRQLAADELERLILRLQVERTLQGRKLAHLVHGRVQATLQAISLRLHRGDLASVQAQREIEESLIELAAELSLEAPELGDVQEGLTKLRELWDGLCDITLEIEPQALLGLSANPQTSNSILVVAEEAITNAVKHAGAEAIRVNVKAENGEYLLAVTNDGVLDGLDAAGRGFGSRTYSALAKSWQLEAGESGVTLQASF